MQEFEKFMLPCLNKKMFGMDCPGCGMQRSIAMLIQGDFTGAFNMYPAIYTILFMGFFLLLHLKFKFKHGHRFLLFLFIINVVFIIINYILKFI